MVDPRIQLALYTRDLLSHSEGFMAIGRSNIENLDLNREYIVIDSLVTSNQYQSQRFDGEAEVMKYTTRSSGDFTLNFYGEEALENAQRWQGLRFSQASEDLQFQYGISVYSPTSLTDVKLLTNATYFNRYELAFKMQYNNSIDVNTLRIDSAQLQFIINE